ncbi:SAM-dependent methyltransferase [Ligilactobacillus agilis]|uniref:SAM-dependent methyltransferase n=1 Tax=Ligilactobacillus agilis TaxID=1601 RepID=A0A6F9Y2S7_9LACO|nr:tRNA (adenine(22)-N(1))-methyltransferase TrmK [Ligilactobacillus agilis]GET11738.1 SAM-dependent methyltransferase [Ligilactobacillus agilis]
MDARKLSNRLLTAAKYVKTGAVLADIGSDHAYLPAYLALNKQIKFGIAGEVVKGPFENAQHEIKKEGLVGKVEARLADGLAAIELTDQVDTITICGMGGPLIASILEKGKAKLVNHPRLILQPNVGEKEVRKWLMQAGYAIVAEEILAEDGHTYELIVADYAPAEAHLNEQALMFGPLLMQAKNPVFISKWRQEILKQEEILTHLEQAKVVPLAKKAQILATIKEIEGVLNGIS